MSDVDTLGDALPREMARVRDEVLPAYLECGPGGTIAVCMMRSDLDAAAKAMIEGRRGCDDSRVRVAEGVAAVTLFIRRQDANRVPAVWHTTLNAAAFQVGDRVVVNAPGWTHDGELGQVVRVTPRPGGYDCLTVKTYRPCGTIDDELVLTEAEVELAPIAIPAAGQPVTVNKAIIGAAPPVATITTAQQFQQVTGMAPPPGMFPPLSQSAAGWGIFNVHTAQAVESNEAPPVNVTPSCSWCDEQHVSPKCERYAKLYAERIAIGGTYDCPEERSRFTVWLDARDEDERTRKRRGLP